MLEPGRLSPKLIPRDVVRAMRGGSAIVDVGIDQGGIAETSRMTSLSQPTYVEEGVVRDVQYVGPVTRYYVALDRGGEVQVLAQNLEEGSSEVLEARGRRVRVEWRPEQESVIDVQEENE